MQYINQINDLKSKLNNEKEKYKQLEQKYIVFNKVHARYYPGFLPFFE